MQKREKKVEPGTPEPTATEFKREVPAVAKAIDATLATEQKTGGKRYRLCPNCGQGDRPSSRDYSDAEYDATWGPGSLGAFFAGLGVRR